MERLIFGRKILTPLLGRRLVSPCHVYHIDLDEIDHIERALEPVRPGSYLFIFIINTIVIIQLFPVIGILLALNYVIELKCHVACYFDVVDSSPEAQETGTGVPRRRVCGLHSSSGSSHHIRRKQLHQEQQFARARLLHRIKTQARFSDQRSSALPFLPQSIPQGAARKKKKKKKSSKLKLMIFFSITNY